MPTKQGVYMVRDDTKDTSSVSEARGTSQEMTSTSGKVLVLVLGTGYEDDVVWIGSVSEGQTVGGVLETVQVGNPMSLHVLAVCEATPLEFFMLRRHLRASVWRDRWYSPTEEVIGFLEALEETGPLCD